jgi:hypothetical protein
MSRTKQLLSFIGSLALLLGIALGASAQEQRRPGPIRYSVSGRIIWKKELGMVPKSPGSKDPAPIPCGSFFAAALESVAAAPGQPAHPNTVATTRGTPNKAGPVPEEGGYYVCTYTLTGLPANRNLIIIAGVGETQFQALPRAVNDPLFAKSPWVGGTQPAPPTGQIRAIRGRRGVVLTDSQPIWQIGFEVFYVLSPR